MHPTFRRAALAAAILGLVLSVAVAACGGDDSASTATSTAATTTAASEVRVIRIIVEGGKPQGGIQRPSVEQGQKVALVVTSDVADEIHLHGYDLMVDAKPGTPARLTFTATIPGRFEVELEDRGVQIADLEVKP